MLRMDADETPLCFFLDYKGIYRYKVTHILVSDNGSGILA